MECSATPATAADLAELSRLYRELEAELVALKPVWGITEALPEPIDVALGEMLGDDGTTILVGRIDGVAVGFLVGTVVPLLPQSGGRRVAILRYLFTEAPAREVGVAEALLGAFMEESRADGIRHFDAHVSPGHRVAKNFLEAHGFKARHIVMHHDAGP